MRLAVEGGAYAGAAKSLRGGNEVAALHYGTLTQRLAGFGGMAGDDYTSEEFARQYDATAQEAVNGLTDVVDAFATLCGLTGQSHLNHSRANASSVYGHPAPDEDGLDFVPGTVDVGSVDVPTSLGANDSDLPAFWNEITDYLEGFAWPNADTGRLREAATVWRSAADDLAGLTSFCDSAVSSLQSQDSPEIPLAAQAVKDLCSTVVDLAAELRSVGDACDEYAASVEEHRAIITGIVKDMAVEAGVSFVAGTIVGFVTFGGGAVAGGAIAGWRIAAAAKKILGALRALEAIAKARVAARLTSVVEKVRPLRNVLERLRSARRLRTGEKPGKPHGTGPHTKPPRRPGDPLDPATRPPTAGSDWEGRVADSGKGDVWQRPGATGNRDSIRIMEPTDRYPYGYVKFIDDQNQPLNLAGKPGSKADMHIPINPDGSYPVPKGWNP
jgi:hypothetical protein